MEINGKHAVYTYMLKLWRGGKWYYDRIKLNQNCLK